MVASLIIDDTEVDVSEELTGHISDFLVTSVIVNSIAIELRISFPKLHIINADAVVRKSFSVHVTDSLADLKELLI